MPAPRLYATASGPVPSVSTVLSQVKGDYRAPHIDAAADRGTAVHALIAADLRGEDLGPIPEDCAKAWAAWVGWSFGHAIVAEAVEQAMAIPGGFGGTPDLIGLVDGHRVAVDWKIRTSRDYHSFSQVGAYAGLWSALHPDRPVMRGLVLRLDPATGEAEEHWLDGAALGWATAGFMGLVAHWHAHQALLASEKAKRAARRAA